jgi:methionyl-tRNA formyltransferase
MSLRLVFMGTPDFAVPTLVEIAGRGHDVAAVYTRAPKPEPGRARGAAARTSGARARDVAGG